MLCAGLSRAIKTEGVPGAVCASSSASLCSWWQGWWCRCYRTTQAVPASLSSLVSRTLAIPSVLETDQAPSSADHSRATAGRASPTAWRGSCEKSCRGPGGQTSAARVRKKLPRWVTPAKWVSWSQRAPMSTAPNHRRGCLRSGERWLTSRSVDHCT